VSFKLFLTHIFTTIAAVHLIGCAAEKNRWTTLVSESISSKVCDVIRVDDSYPNGQRVQEGEKLHGYKMISQPISLSKESRDELSEILKDAKTYINYSVPRDCLFRPGVAFHFAKQNRKVDVLVCFSCNELRYYLNDKIVGQSYFKSVRLSKLTKKLFPDDKIIQSMK